MEQTIKRCSRCRRSLPPEAFRGERKNCEKCCADKRQYHRRVRKTQREDGTLAARSRRENLQRFFGLTVDDYARLLEAQGGVCAICKQSETSTWSRGGNAGVVKRLAVDHVHGTKIIRGLLCSRCNCMIGFALDDPERLRAAIDYLKNYTLEAA